jgi:hypothetical protein
MEFIQLIKDKGLPTAPLPKKLFDSRLRGTDNAYPLLRAYLYYLRKLNGINNQIDTLNEHRQMIKEFNYLCEHSFLLCLILTGRFNRIYKLIQAEEELSKILFLMKKIKKRCRCRSLNRYSIYFSKHRLEKQENTLNLLHSLVKPH